MVCRIHPLPPWATMQEMNKKLCSEPIFIVIHLLDERIMRTVIDIVLSCCVYLYNIEMYILSYCAILGIVGN